MRYARLSNKFPELKLKTVYTTELAQRCNVVSQCEVNIYFMNYCINLKLYSFIFDLTKVLRRGKFHLHNNKLFEQKSVKNENGIIG